jgi:signal transduction histidine kinase
VKSIGARLALWYATASTVTLACLFVVGYYLLHGYLIHGLDLLNQSEFEELRARLGPQYAALSSAQIEQRIRETTEAASALFYIDIHRHGTGTIFYSSNLNGRALPDIKGLHRYDVTWERGPLRVAEFILPPYDVTIATPSAQAEGVMEGFAAVGAGLLLLLVAISFAIGLGLSRLALQPVRVISTTALGIRSENLSERIPVSDVKDEISDLARLLNAMFDRLEVSFTSVRRFAADASHELKTPLSLVRLHAEKLLASGTLGHEGEEGVQTLLEELLRVSAIIEDLLFLSRAESRTIELQLAPNDPAPLLANFNVDAQVLAEHHGVHFSYTHEGNGLAICEPRSIRRVLLNLLTNGIAASPAGGHIRLRSLVSGARWRVELEDEGCGVPDSQREHIFDRFVRLKQVSHPKLAGTGLGLAICRGIVELHHGHIRAEAGSDGRGLRVVFEIPAEPVAMSPDSISSYAPAPATSK